MDPFESKLFEGTSTEQKLEVSVRALGQAAKTFSLAAVHLSQAIDRLELIARRLEAKSWEQAINAELKRREKNASS